MVTTSDGVKQILSLLWFLCLSFFKLKHVFVVDFKLSVTNELGLIDTDKGEKRNK